MAPAPLHVRVETLDGYRILRHPYRAMLTGRATLRLIVSITARGVSPCEVRIEVDDAFVEVMGPRGTFAMTAIDQLFVVERQPPAWRFLPWYGVFARRNGRSDQLLVETPDVHVARFVERAIEQRLGLRDEPVRGELRLAE
jgi:hypothetical protein